MSKVKSFAELDPSIFGFKVGNPSSEKPSQKALNIFSRDLLQQNPELNDNIKSTLRLLHQKQSRMPVIHITSTGLRKDGRTMSTGFTENIKQEGFQARHTNVGVFVERGKTTRVAEAKYFIDHPEEFIKSFYLLLQRYGSHGSRTNKQALGKNRGVGEGIPEMLIVDGNIELEKGSDYDDHFILPKGATADKIIGEINLEIYRPYREHLKELFEKFLQKLSGYYTHEIKAA